MTLTNRFERWFKPRFAVIYPFGFFFLFFCFIDETSLRTGIGFIIAGVIIRLWSNGYAIKNDKLTTSGPYAFVRNPLYLGTFLIAIGFVLTLRSDPAYLEWIAGALLILGLCVMYYRTINGEQGMLLQKFGGPYADYCKNVPVIIPWKLVPYAKGEKWPFTMQRLILSKEHKTVFWIFILLVVFYLKTRLFLEGKPLTETGWTLFGMSISLIIVDIAFEMNKNKFK